MTVSRRMCLLSLMTAPVQEPGETGTHPLLSAGASLTSDTEQTVHPHPTSTLRGRTGSQHFVQET